jgi:pimeloyl-ACP methyl ester carboxylesterase
VANVVVAHGGWSSGWAWKKLHPLMAAAGHRFVTPTYTGLGERAHLANPDNDLELHIQDVLNVLFYDDLRDVALIGHSYGGMVATGVADRARDRIKQLIYLDAFVPNGGQSLLDNEPPEMAERMLARAKEGDGWRIPPNPTPPDTSEADLAWIMERRLPQSVKCFTQKLQFRNGPLTLPRAYIYCRRHVPGDIFRKFMERARRDGWPCEEMDASHSPQITAPDALVAALQKLIAK